MAAVNAEAAYPAEAVSSYPIMCAREGLTERESAASGGSANDGRGRTRRCDPGKDLDHRRTARPSPAPYAAPGGAA